MLQNHRACVEKQIKLWKDNLEHLDKKIAFYEDAIAQAGS